MTGFGKKKNSVVADCDEPAEIALPDLPAINTGVVRGVFFCEGCLVVINTETVPLSPCGTCPHCDTHVVIFDPFSAYERMVTKISV